MSFNYNAVAGNLPVPWSLFNYSTKKALIGDRKKVESGTHAMYIGWAGGN